VSKKGKKIMSLKGDFSFRPEINGVHQGSTTIRIGPRSKINVAKPFSTRRGRNKSLQEVSNLSGQERLSRTPPYKAKNIVSFDQVSLANSK